MLWFRPPRPTSTASNGWDVQQLKMRSRLARFPAVKKLTPVPSLLQLLTFAVNGQGKETTRQGRTSSKAFGGDEWPAMLPLGHFSQERERLRRLCLPKWSSSSGEIEVVDVLSVSAPTAGFPKVSCGCASLCALLSSENKQIVRTCWKSLKLGRWDKSRLAQCRFVMWVFFFLSPEWFILRLSISLPVGKTEWFKMCYVKANT